MSELPDQPPPSRRRAPRRGKRARFVLPAEHHDEDERADEVIEAFLDGPPESVRKVSRARPRRVDLRAVRGPVPMDTRADWDTALRHEDARLARYGRPATILVIRLVLPTAAVADRIAGRVGAIVREHIRETDRVTRTSPNQFHVLLPETEEPEGDILAERIRDACAEQIVLRSGRGLEIRAAAVSPGSGETLRDALRVALEAVAA